AFVPDHTIQKLRNAGACQGSFALADCLAQGHEVGAAAARDAGFEAADGAAPSAAAAPAEEPLKPVWLVPHGKQLGEGAKHFVDLQNDVTAADVHLASR